MPPSAWKPGEYLWRVEPVFDEADALARQVGTAPLVAQVLANRGITDPETAKRFLNPKLTDLHDPAELPGARDAAARIVAACRSGEKILLYGDYDVDGMTGVAVLYSCLALAQANVDVYVPHRLDEGYGLHTDALDSLIDGGAKLIVTVDCGISAVDAVAHARTRGVDLIVTDHHVIAEQLPDAAAIVHPAVEGGAYPFRDLAGAGVAFKLAWQIARELCGSDRVDGPMRDFLVSATCLAALGTIADVVPLVDENRVIATYGLTGLTHTQHVGLRALIESAGLDGEKLDAYHVGFVLAPRLNAAGRMGHAAEAVELLTGRAGERSREIADYLTQQNTERQKVERAIADQAIEMVESQGLATEDRRGIVLACEDWHGGVIGIVASRLVRRFNRPAVMIAINGDGKGQGSCRSIAGLHMRDALAACEEHLIGFGGHAMAAGLTIDPANIDAFTDAFVAHVNSQLTPDDLRPTLRIDAETSINLLNFQAVEHLVRLAPHGQSNPAPVIALRGCQVIGDPRRMGQRGKTLGLVLGHGKSTIRAVGFGMGDLVDRLTRGGDIDVAGSPVFNTFRGRTNVEFMLKDVIWP
jgi:single-stranded-DNA-specific exonuclease